MIHFGCRQTLHECFIVSQTSRLMPGQNLIMKNVHLTEQDLIRVRAAAAYLSQNLDKRIPIPQLARSVKLSAKKLKAGFQLEYHTGAFHYQVACRFEKVQKMLLANEPLKLIAAETGYRDEQKLIKAFRKKFHTTPVQWKKEQLNNSKGNQNIEDSHHVNDSD